MTSAYKGLVEAEKVKEASGKVDDDDEEEIWMNNRRWTVETAHTFGKPEPPRPMPTGPPEAEEPPEWLTHPEKHQPECEKELWDLYMKPVKSL